MTVRALLIGLLLGLAITAFGYMNDWVLKQAYMASDLVPVSVYGILVLGLVLANPLLKWIRKSQLNGREWAVIIALMLVACVIPGPGLMWTFNHTLVLPNRLEALNAGWRDRHVTDFAPAVMLVDPADDVRVDDPDHPDDNAAKAYDRVVEGFATGMQVRRGEWVAPGKIPWRPWIKPLAFWLPLLGLSFIAGICLILIVHRQWAFRERLRYPVADFASELINGAGDGAYASIFHNGRFWLGFAPVVVIILINGLHAWYPNSIQVPLNVPLAAFGTKWQWLTQMPGWWAISGPTVFFAAVGFAYFVSSEVSFSIGISAVAWGLMGLALTKAGVDMSGDYLSGGIYSNMLFGAYLGLALMIGYVGRKFYLNVLINALGVSTREKVNRSVVWACRIALLAAAGMVLMLVFVVHLHWLLAIVFVLLTGMLFLMVTRINVETGLFFIQPAWHAVGIIAGLFGLAAIGPNMLIVMGLLAAVISIDPRVCLMPLVANAMRIGETQNLSPQKLSRWMLLAVLLALVVGVFATLYVQYNFGAGGGGWGPEPGRMAFDMMDKNRLNFDGAYDSKAWVDFDITKFKPDTRLVYSAGAGLLLVLACSAMRLRFTWWPLHPILFLVWGTFPILILSASFLLGWFIKTIITHFGGSKTYHRAKPLFVGMVAGEFVGGVFWMIFNLIYYMNKGVSGPQFRVHG